MSTFNFAQYQQIAALEQSQNSGDGTKVSYFKLKDDGDIAIARLNIAATDDLMFASVHTISMNGKWIKVSCLNPLGSYNGDCALCSAHATNPKGSVSKAVKKLFIPMLVSYRDPNSATGYTAPVPVIWDRPAAFSRELANKLMIAGDLRNTLVLITRNGKAGDMQTTYSVDILPAEHPVFKPEMIPADFSAFNGFNIAKHSYWEKTAEEINTYLTTGQFPSNIQTKNPQTPQTVGGVANVAASYATPTNPDPAVNFQAAAPTIPVAPLTEAPASPAVTTPITAPAAPAVEVPTAPVRNFSGFSF